MRTVVQDQDVRELELPLVVREALGELSVSAKGGVCWR